MMAQEATLQQVREYFGMTAGQLMREWKELDQAAKDWFKVELAKVLIAEAQGQV